MCHFFVPVHIRSCARSVLFHYCTFSSLHSFRAFLSFCTFSFLYSFRAFLRFCTFSFLHSIYAHSALFHPCAGRSVFLRPDFHFGQEDGREHGRHKGRSFPNPILPSHPALPPHPTLSPPQAYTSQRSCRDRSRRSDGPVRTRTRSRVRRHRRTHPGMCREAAEEMH